jgi:hypothetical protein
LAFSRAGIDRGTCKRKVVSVVGKKPRKVGENLWVVDLYFRTRRAKTSEEGRGQKERLRFNG